MLFLRFPSTSLPLTRRFVTLGLRYHRYNKFHTVPQDEDVYFSGLVADVEKSWQSSRYAGIKRPYTALNVASKQGTLPQSYPSSTMATKLFKLLRERALKGEPVHTSMHGPICCFNHLLTLRSGSN